MSHGECAGNSDHCRAEVGAHFAKGLLCSCRGPSLSSSGGPPSSLPAGSACLGMRMGGGLGMPGGRPASPCSHS